MTWTDALRANPLSWLLEPENPPVRYWTLRGIRLTDRPTNAEVTEVPAAIPAWPAWATWPPC